MDELAQRMVAFVGPCTRGAVINALCRIRRKRPDVPLLPELLASNVVEELGEPGWKDVQRNRPTPKKFPRARPQVRIDLDAWLPNYTLAASDFHFPIHDQRGVDGLINLGIDMASRGQVHGMFPGDMYDFYGLSRFAHEARRVLAPGFTIQEEVDSAKPFWVAVAEFCERVDYFPGNHERRLETFIQANYALHDLKALQLRNVLEIPSAVNVHPFRTRIDMGPLAIEHGDELTGSGTKHSTANVLANHPDQDTIYGHTHRLQISRRTKWAHGEPRKRVAISLGHMSMTESHGYASYPDWQNGFAVLEWYRAPNGEPRFNEHLIQVEDGRFSFGGKLYDGA